VDNDGKVGIGTPPGASRLRVGGMVESVFGGFKFPDGTVQMTAGFIGFPKHTEASYIVFKKDGDVLAQDGKNGRLVDTGGDANSTTVINKVIEDTNSEGGGMIFIRPGEYELTGRLNIVGKDNITVMGTDGTFLTDPRLGAAMLIDGDSNNITLHRLTFRDCNGMGVNLKHGNNIRIIDCMFEDIQGPAIQGRVGDDANNPLNNIWIVRCRVRGADLSNEGPSAEGGIYFYRTNNLFLHNNIVECCGSVGICIARCTNHIICSNNIVRNNDRNAVNGQGHGIYAGSCELVTVRGNVVTGNGGHGFEGGSGSTDCNKLTVGCSSEGTVWNDSTRGSRFIVAENIFIENGFNTTKPSGSGAGHYRSGIYITGRDQVVCNNICRNNYGSGITVGYAEKSSRTIVKNNVIANNNQGPDTRPNFGSGITCHNIADANLSPSDQLILIENNLIYNDEGGVQLRAIHCEDTVDGITIIGNRVNGHPQPQIYYNSSMSNIIVRGNPGFKTEAFDIATDTYAGATSGVVDVNLADYLDDVNEGIVAIDPNLFRVTPRATSAGGYSGGYFNYWVEQTSDTNMGIYWDCNEPRDKVGFNWMYGKP